MCTINCEVDKLLCKITHQCVKYIDENVCIYTLGCRFDVLICEFYTFKFKMYKDQCALQILRVKCTELCVILN